MRLTKEMLRVIQRIRWQRMDNVAKPNLWDYFQDGFMLIADELGIDWYTLERLMQDLYPEHYIHTN